MVNLVRLNERAFEVNNFYMEVIHNDALNIKQLTVRFDFKVTSEEYHEVTTLLYENDFTVEIPEENLQFEATIYQYATSLTNLYEANQVADYFLELREKVNV